MTLTLSNDTQAMLLLTAPLINGRADAATDLLTHRDYQRLARLLANENLQPGDILTSDSKDFSQELRTLLDSERLKRLLGRGFQLSQAVERWQSRAIWVVGQKDEEYPQRLAQRLKEISPPILYGCGDAELLQTGGLAVVGSRDVDTELVEFTESVGRMAAQAGVTLVSGGARGIDQAAMRGALEDGGKVVGVLADSLERAALNREHREVLLDGRLAAISPYDPLVGFNVGHAMQRNKLIYGLADAALVVNSDYEKGGTWAGAVEQLEKLHLVRVFVRSRGEIGTGLEALQRKGAAPWPSPTSPETFKTIIEDCSSNSSSRNAQLSFLET